MIKPERQYTVNDASRAYNEMPIEVRQTTGKILNQHLIQHLKEDIEEHEKLIRKLNERIKYLEEWL